jgi:WD40 repeat protein/serine/threonine protein kinase
MQQLSEVGLLNGQTVRTYELRKVIGIGGFGIVYQAYQQVVERDVAIKVILPEFADQPDFIRHFESEAQIVAHLEHPHIVPLYDFWREPGGAFLVMRWLRGGSLRDKLLRSNLPDLSVLARILDQISDALAVAHQKNIIHQDIKPENILLDEYENAYLSDFGIAKKPFASEDAEAVGAGFGTAAYASPEQINRRPITPQTDIYNLGMMLYELLTGTIPFASASDSTILYKQLHEPVPLIKRNNLPSEVNDVIWRATAKRPEDRYASAPEMAEDFRRALKQEIAAVPGIELPSFSRPQPDPVAPTATRILFEQEAANPYKGLQPFSEADQADFFGREDLINHLLDRLRPSHRTFRLLAVVGPSGSGKSSVVQAGLLPRLRRGAVEGSERWFITQMKPGAEPFRELEAALVRIAHKSVPEMQQRLRELDGGLSDVLTEIQPLPGAEFVLVIDQFEEVFTLCESETERSLFLNVLLQAVNDPASHLRVILTLRADFYDRPLMYSGIGELMQGNTEVVLPLSVDGLMQAIARPAERHGLALEDGLLPVIVEDVHRQPSALPLLQHALSELHTRREGKLLTKAVYFASGGVVGALALRAEEIYQSLEAKSQLLARQLFLHLVTTNENGVSTSRRVLRAELIAAGADAAAVTEVLDAFRKYYLLTFDHHPITSSPTVQISHEALIQVWERLKDWISDNREDLRLRQALSVASHEWDSSVQEPSFLATGSRLARFEALQEKRTIILSADEQQYLDASIAARQRAVRRGRMVVAGLAVLALGAFLLALFAFDQQAAAVAERDRADLESRVSRSRELAATALTNRNQVDLSLLLSLEALRSANTFEARNSLLTTLESQPHLLSFLHGHSDGVRAVAFSPSGEMLASAGRDNTIILWDVAAQSEIKALSGHTGWVNGVAFSPDGRLLASASDDATVRLWDVNTGASIGEPLTGHTGSVHSVAFSPDGRLLASAGDDGSIRLWEVSTGAAVGDPLIGHLGAVWSVAFSPDGTQLATASSDQSILLWDVATRAVVGAPLLGHTNWVMSLAFSPDGQILASGGADNAIMLWNVATREPIGRTLTGHQGWVRSLAFSPDRQRLISGSADASVRLWDLTDLSQVSLNDVYLAHRDAVWSVAFSPNGHTLVSAGADKQIIVWDTEADTEVSRLFAVSPGPIYGLSLNAAGDVLATAGAARVGSAARISLWDFPTGTLRESLQDSSSLITSLAFNPATQTLLSASFDSIVRFWQPGNTTPLGEITIPGFSVLHAIVVSPDGKRLAAATDQAEITVWDLENSTQVATLQGHTNSIYSLAFSPDGKTLASGSRDNTIRFWNMDTMLPAGEPISGSIANGLAFSPDGRFFAAASRDYLVRLWDVATRQLYREPFQGHTDEVNAVAFSMDGQMLASGSDDGAVRLWDISTGQAVGLPFTEHRDAVNGLLFTSDGYLVSAGQDGAIIRRDIAFTSLEQVACRIANRSFSPEEWNSYFQNIPFHQTCTGANSS